MEKEVKIKKLEGYHKLLVHQKADELAFQSYKATRDFPREELFGLISQIRRSAVSVPANIAEGYTRNGIKDKVHFYNIAQGSLTELEYLLEFSCRLDYLKETELENLIRLKEDTGKLLYRFIESTKN